jgi:hypothetical protein
MYCKLISNKIICINSYNIVCILNIYSVVVTIFSCNVMNNIEIENKKK